MTKKKRKGRDPETSHNLLKFYRLRRGSTAFLPQINNKKERGTWGKKNKGERGNEYK